MNEDEELVLRVASILRERREAIGLSQRSLAKKLGLADEHMAVHRMEKDGLGIRSLGRLRRVCQALNTSMLGVLREAGIE